ncbi:phage antirepressor N-terminal domain-containing protein [Azotobacter salinestris]|uniref:phage antirepressor N-terminal domain-containing protein n=1 Tax=Azotobacter salinestris TaxID=69964 RepID=UPI0012669251|nr:phage antirepressor N-terminal domain-containing protein [Azotobacter salinestris]
MSAIISQLDTVSFHGHDLTVITTPAGEHLVAMKPICEAIGLSWRGQNERIQRHEVLKEGMRVIRTPSTGGEQETICLPLDYLNGWLFGVDASRVKPEIRERLVQYQRECFAALAAYWQQGEAVNPRTVAPATAEPIHLTYNDRPFRIVPEGAALWFVAVDVARALDMRDGHCLTRHLRSEHKALRQVGHKRLSLIDRPGLELALHHASPARAEPLRLWLEAALEQFMPVAAPRALPGGLSGEQQGALKALVAARIEALPELERGRAATRCWSALKSKFGCGYKEIAPERFTEAVSLVARIVLEGELLEPEAPKGVGRLDIDYPIEDWKARNPQQFRHDNPNSPDLVVGYGDLLSSGYSPCCDLLDKLHNAGYRVDGAFYELRSYQNLMLQMDMAIRLMVGNARQAIEGFEQDRRRLQKFVGVKGHRA